MNSIYSIQPLLSVFTYTHTHTCKHTQHTHILYILAIVVLVLRLRVRVRVRVWVRVKVRVKGRVPRADITGATRGGERPGDVGGEGGVLHTVSRG